MNIAIIAPTKFDFQDLAIVELGLRWPDSGAPTLRAEPRNGEDAELTWEEEGRRRLCEVQVKGRSTGKLDMATLAAYLAHFPDQQSQGCLLDRLIADPTRVALFVASERCRDDVAACRVPTTWTGDYRTKVLHRRYGQALSVALKRLSEGPSRAKKKQATHLELSRAAHLAKLAYVDLDHLTEALSRVFIHEEERSAKIVLRLQQKLFDVGVPTDRLFDGIARLKHVVAEDRASRPDVFLTLRRVRAEFAPEQLARPKYLLRGQEEDFATDLARERAILLSGPPRVGKSWLALELAGRLQRQGYEVARSGHIDQADRFLNDPVSKLRAYVLEDPLGSRQAAKEGSALVSDLRRLLTSLPADRRLIVAKSESPILQIFRESDLRKCTLGQLAWHVLEPLPVDQAEALWRRDAADAGVAPEQIERVANVVRDRTDLRDAGAIAHLATTFDKLRSDASPNEIVAQGSSDAVDFAQVLADESAVVGKILRGVAVSTEIATGVHETDLAFVTSASDERPSLDQSDGVLVFGQHQPTVAPAYVATPMLSDASKHAVTTLRRRRVLDSQSNRINFVHPYLRAGAQALFRPDLDEDMHAAAADTERALAAVDPKVSLAAARNLDWIASALATRESGLLRAVALAKGGLRSRYPATRDACFDFLTIRAADLPSEELGKMRHWVRAVDVGLDQIEEVAGHLVVSEMATRYGSDTVPRARVQPYVDAIEAGQPIDLDPTLAYAILVVFQQHDVDLTPKLMERLLSMDEAVLRSAASAVWLRRARDSDVDILRRIENDATPAVSNAVLDAVVHSWTDLPEDRREAILSILVAHATKPGSATTLLDRLAAFNRVEKFGKKPPWPIFLRIAPVAFRHAPRVIFQDGRIVSAIQGAIKAGEGAGLIPFLDVWAKHLAERLRARLPDEFELSIPEAMLDIGQPAWRWPLIQDLLEAPNTGARLRIIATLVDRWVDLTPDERRAIVTLLMNDDADVNWLRAAALTRPEVPHDLLAALTGHANLLDFSPPDLLAALGEPVYRACLHVFIGVPQPLWWLGTHHTTAKAWANAVRWSAAATNRPAFALALDDRIALTDDEAWLADLVDQFHVDDLPAVFERFLHRKVKENGNWRTLAWNRLLDRGETIGVIDEWIVRISAVAPLFLDHLRDVRFWLGKGPHENRVLKSLGADLNVYKLLKVLSEAVRILGNIDVDALDEVDDDDGEALDKELSDEEVIGPFLELLQRALEQDPPRLFKTWDDVSAELQRIKAPKVFIDWAKAKRRDALEEEMSSKETTAEDQLILVGWRGPR